MEMVGNDNGKLRTNRTTHRKMDEIKELLDKVVELLKGTAMNESNFARPPDYWIAREKRLLMKEKRLNKK